MIRLDDNFACLAPLVKPIGAFAERILYPSCAASLADAEKGYRVATKGRDFVRAKFGLQ